MKKIIALMMYLMPALTFANAGEYVGYWSVKCGGFGGHLEIDSSNKAKININDNNLYVSAIVKIDSNGGGGVFYRDIIESVNDEVSWVDISKSIPIARVSIKNGTLHMLWNGFFDAKKNKYVWKLEPDFSVASDGDSNIEMKKCDFE